MDVFRKTYDQVDPLLYCFTVSEDPVFDWFAYGRDTLDGVDLSHGGMDFFAHFLGCDTVRAEAKALEIPNPLRLPDTKDEMTFGLAAPLMFEGQLAQSLVGRVFYVGFQGPHSEAKKLAQDFRFALFQDRYEDVLMYDSNKAWSPWFCDLGDDWTVIIFDRRLRRIWLLCKTDTD